MPLRVTFHKAGNEIKQAIQRRVGQLKSRLERRYTALNEFMKDENKLRSYLIRSSQYNVGHGSGGNYVLFGEDDISSEEKEEIDQLCRRIFEIEQEIRRLQLIALHMEDDREFELDFGDLISYGFDLPQLG